MDRLRTERHPGVWHSGGLEATALKAEVWVDTVTEGGRRFMVAWRKEQVDAAKIRQMRREKQRDWETCFRTRKRRILRSDTL